MNSKRWTTPIEMGAGRRAVTRVASDDDAARHDETRREGSIGVARDDARVEVERRRGRVCRREAI